MGDQRKNGITWTNRTWNPITGCSHASDGCRNCYAERLAPRLAAMGQSGYTKLPWTAQNAAENVKLHPDRLDQPYRWSRPRRIFVCSMADLFHPQVPDEFLDRVFAVMACAPQHIFQVLTKRADRMLAYMTALYAGKRQLGSAAVHQDGGGFFNLLMIKDAIDGRFPHVWMGVSVEDQKNADVRVPLLLQTPARVRWLSCEPLLGSVSLSEIPHESEEGPIVFNALSDDLIGGLYFAGDEACRRLDWVVVGGESGPAARPMSPRWARLLRYQCVAAGVAFHFKQWGEWAPAEGASYSFIHEDEAAGLLNRYTDGSGCVSYHAAPAGAVVGAGRIESLYRVGKHAAGRLLDGVEWNQYPEVKA